MSAQKIDFKHIREYASIESIMEHYGIDLHKDGTKDGQFKALCAFHDDHKPSMKVNTDRNIYHCFACDAGGNVLDFVKNYDAVELRDAAKTVAEICDISLAPSRASKAQSTKNRRAKSSKSSNTDRKSISNKKSSSLEKRAKTKPVEFSEETEEVSDGTVENKVLTFALKNLVTEHPFLDERGLTAEIINTFDLGIATRGIMKDRLAIPIHNQDGKMVAYCGRYVGNNIPEDEAKYKMPKGFHKEIEMFNLHRCKGSTIVTMVESFFSVFKLHRMEYSVISPMGRSVSDAQIELLKNHGAEAVILLFDGDDPGRTAVTTVSRQLLAAGFEIVAPVVPENFKPHRMSDEALGDLVGSAL